MALCGACAAGLLVLALVFSGCGEIAGPGAPDPCEVPYRNTDVWAPAWSPDGDRVAFESALDQEGNFSPGIYIHDLASGAERKVYDDDTFIMSLSWSTSKNMMLLGRGATLTLLDLSTGEERLMNTLYRAMDDASWTWEQDSIYYRRGFIGGWNVPDSVGLFVTSPDGGPGRKFVSTDGTLIFPVGGVALSPGGRWLAFVQPNQLEEPPFPWEPQRGGGEICMVRRDGTRFTRLTNLDGFPRNPRWIDGGRAIIFEFIPRECDGLANLVGHTWIVRPDGGPARRYFTDLGDRAAQFGMIPAVDRTGKRIIVPQVNAETRFGALYLLDLQGQRLKLIHPLKVPPMGSPARRSIPEVGH